MSALAASPDFDDFDELAEQLIKQAFNQKAGHPGAVVMSAMVYHFALEARRFMIPENILKGLVMLASAVHDEDERQLEREDAGFFAAEAKQNQQEARP